MTRHAIAFLSLGLLGAGCGSKQGIEEPEPPLAQADDHTVITRLVFESQRAGFERHDVEGYLAAWSDEAVLIAARGPEPGPYDHSMDQAKNEATKRLLFSVPVARSPNLSITDDKVDIAGSEARLTWRLATTTGDFIETVGESYRLRRSAAGWRIVENRWWPIEIGPRGETTIYDDAYWQRVDAQVESTRVAGGRPYIDALIAAGRHTEAWGALSSTDPANRDTEFYATRAWMAVTLGRVDDARTAVCEARALDPRAELPSWASEVRCTEN